MWYDGAMRTVHFIDGALAGQTREVSDEIFGYVYDKVVPQLRWQYIFRGNQMRLFWNGTVDEWASENIFREFLRAAGRYEDVYVNQRGERV